MPMQVTIEYHRPEWRQLFEAEAIALKQALGRNTLHIHHIGSTSIPGIYAKPIIDILVEVADLEAVNQRNSQMESLGYEAMGEFGIKGRRYFRKDNESAVRTHHVHVFLSGSSEVKRHLGFRDFMIACPAWAKRYSDLKQKLVKAHPESIESYMDGKDPFIKEVDTLVEQWAREFDVTQEIVIAKKM